MSPGGAGTGELSPDYVQVRGRSRPRAALPNALEAWPVIARRLRGQRLLLFLDYDGTLAPIAPRPELAEIRPQMRAALEAASRAWTTALVSGRARADLERRVGLQNVVYAGSHGFDIRGPGRLRLEVAGDSVRLIRQAAEELRQTTAAVAGAIVEDKGFSVALHHRQVARADLPALKRAFDDVLHRHPGLRATMGNRVLELRPAVRWDKGKAVSWLLETLAPTAPGVTPFYIGDDVTDEDAFGALAGRGVTILVGAIPSTTCAAYALRDVEEVRQLLLRLAALSGPGAEEP